MAGNNRYQNWRHETWPEPDRTTWQNICRSGDDFDPPGRAATWTAASRQNVEMAYGRYLQHLAGRGQLRGVQQISERLDLNHIRTFTDQLANEVAPSTVWGILQALSRAFSAMAPHSDRRAFHQVLGRIKQRTSLSRKLEGRLIDPPELIEVAIAMMQEADKLKRGKKAAVLYRNGALIMGATCCPLRRDAWFRMSIGRHLQFDGRRAWVRFEASELKSTSRPFEAELPAEYVPYLHRYINFYRPFLFTGRSDNGHLWLAWKGQPLIGQAMSMAVQFALKNRCGKNFSFHMFRHAAATFIENAAPDQARMIAGVLHHADGRMAEKHYIRGQRTAAMKSYQSLVQTIAQKGRR